MNNSQYGQVDEYGLEREKIQCIAKKLRALRGKNNILWDSPAEWGVKYSYMKGKPTKALTITLSPTGCAWAKNGGCTMCGEYEGSSKGDSIPDYLHIAQFAKAVAELVPLYKPKWLRINQEGNYANNNETKQVVQKTILKLATQLKGIKRITIESRPQYLTEEILTVYSNIIKNSGIELEIGMGFESGNDVIRNICINKGESIADFEKTLKLMKKHGILSLAYVLLKPPFLTENEAIGDAVNSIIYANKIGFERISLEPMSIHKYTIVDALTRLSQYSTPWLWSLIEVIKQCRDISELGIGGIGYYPIPAHLSQNHCNCKTINVKKKGNIIQVKECEKHIFDALKKFSRYRDFSVFDNLFFSCMATWKSECGSCDSLLSLKERIIDQLNNIDINQYELSVKKDLDIINPMNTIFAGSIYIARGSQTQHYSNGG